MKLEIYEEDNLLGTLSLNAGKILMSGNISSLKKILSHYNYIKDPEEMLKYMSHHLRSYIYAKEIGEFPKEMSEFPEEIR